MRQFFHRFLGITPGGCQETLIIKVFSHARFEYEGEGDANENCGSRDSCVTYVFLVTRTECTEYAVLRSN